MKIKDRIRSESPKERPALAKKLLAIGKSLIPMGKLKIDYTTWSIDDLKKELKIIEKTIKLKETNERKHVLAELKAVARRSGYSLEEFLALELGSPNQSATAKVSVAQKNKKSFTKKRAPAKIKYRSPLNSEDTWTGRGRKPKWISKFLEHGGTLEEISV